MRYIGFDREEEAELWARKRMGLTQAPPFFRAISTINDDNNFVFVVVLTNFSMRNVDINIAMDGSYMTPKCTLEIFNKVFTFLFDELHVSRVTGLVPISNKKAQKVDEKFGFVLEGIMRNALPNNEDLLVYGFLEKEYKNHKWYRG
jgi:RimJ/RimL family protein N-acetyltransferase